MILQSGKNALRTRARLPITPFMPMTQTSPISIPQPSPIEALPSFTPRPIISIGAGGIVHDSHLPAYRKAGFPVAGLVDVNREKALGLAKQFGIPHVADTI